MRKIKIAPGEYYHIFNRGNNKQPIFFEERDWIRFLFLVVYFQLRLNLTNLGRQVNHFVRHRVFNINMGEIGRDILNERLVEVVSFALMPNHFHLIVRESQDGGISKYMQKILIAYTKYINTKNKISGHLFQGPFRAVHIKTNEQLLHLSAYVHRNPKEIREWRRRPFAFPWSSYQDYVGENRWGGLLATSLILDQFSSPQEYKVFAETSGTKELDEEILVDIND